MFSGDFLCLLRENICRVCDNFSLNFIYAVLFPNGQKFQGTQYKFEPLLFISYQQLGKTFEDFLIKILVGIKLEETNTAKNI